MYNAKKIAESIVARACSVCIHSGEDYINQRGCETCDADHNNFISDPDRIFPTNLQGDAVYIFKLNSLLKSEDAERVRQALKTQIEDGVVLTDARTDFVGREMIVEGFRVKVEFAPEREKPYTIDELEEYRAGENGLRAMVMVADLKPGETKDVSAILDWDFVEKELVAVWGYKAEPYRARDYMKTWVAYPFTFAGAGQ